MIIKKIKLFIFLIFIIFSSHNYSNSFENKIIYKIDNEIITTIDLKNEINYLIALNPNLKKLSKKIIFIHFDLTSRNQDKKRELLLKIAKNCKTVKVLTIKTPFKIWHERMRNRDQELRTAVPKNNATAIYRNSLFNPLFAKWQYDAVYRQWARFSKNLEAEDYLLIKN